MNANVEMNIQNNNRNVREEAIQNLMQKMSAIPNSNEITSAMILDWVNNVGPDDVANMNYEDIRELIEGIYQDMGRNPPGFTDDHYKQIFNAFTDFVLEYYADEEQQGGKRRKRRKHRKSRKTAKKIRRSKKTRRHK